MRFSVKHNTVYRNPSGRIVLVRPGEIIESSEDLSLSGLPFFRVEDDKAETAKPILPKETPKKAKRVFPVQSEDVD